MADWAGCAAREIYGPCDSAESSTRPGLPLLQPLHANSLCTASGPPPAFGSQQNKAVKGLYFFTSWQRKLYTSIFTAGGICVAHFVMDISDKISHVTNQVKAAASISVIIRASNLIELPLKLALDHNVTIFFKPSLDCSISNVTAPFISPSYLFSAPSSFFLWTNAVTVGGCKTINIPHLA